MEFISDEFVAFTDHFKVLERHVYRIPREDFRRRMLWWMALTAELLFEPIGVRARV